MARVNIQTPYQAYKARKAASKEAKITKPKKSDVIKVNLELSKNAAKAVNKLTVSDTGLTPAEVLQVQIAATRGAAADYSIAQQQKVDKATIINNFNKKVNGLEYNISALHAQYRDGISRVKFGVVQFVGVLGVSYLVNYDTMTGGVSTYMLKQNPNTIYFILASVGILVALNVFRLSKYKYAERLAKLSVDLRDLKNPKMPTKKDK